MSDLDRAVVATIAVAAFLAGGALLASLVRPADAWLIALSALIGAYYTMKAGLR